MYYVITVKDGLVTGRHESTTAITADTFATSDIFAGNIVQEIEPDSEYRAGFQLAEFDAQGKLRPLIDRINEGLAEVPAGFELIDGELVETLVTETEAPPTLMARVVAAENKAAQAGVPDKAARVMFRTLAANDTISEADALDNQEMFETWEEYIGKPVIAGMYLRYQMGLYRVKQNHTVQAHYLPGVDTAALYTRVQEPGAGPEEWVNGQSYAKNVEVTRNGGVWLSGVDNNVWEPGAAGVYDDIWKRVRDA